MAIYNSEGRRNVTDDGGAKMDKVNKSIRFGTIRNYKHVEYYFRKKLTERCEHGIPAVLLPSLGDRNSATAVTCNKTGTDYKIPELKCHYTEHEKNNIFVCDRLFEEASGYLR